jgi:GNAT superfamily N-acetyltransferase
MTFESFAIVPFASTFDRTTFSCGEPDLDDWLQRYAKQAERKGNTRTFFAVDRDRIVGFYAQRTYEIDADDAAKALGIGHRRYPMPAVLIAQLAVDTRYQGRGVGTWLLIQALHRIAELSTEIGFEVVVVHALSNEASVFYRRAGFRAAEDKPLTLLLPLHDLRRTFGIG